MGDRYEYMDCFYEAGSLINEEADVEIIRDIKVSRSPKRLPKDKKN